MSLLCLLPLHERIPLLGTPDGIKLEVSSVAFALQELLALNFKLLKVLRFAALLLILLPEAVVLLHEILPLVYLSAAFFDLFNLVCKMLNSLIGLPNLLLLLGKLARESLFFREARYSLHFEVS